MTTSDEWGIGWGPDDLVSVTVHDGSPALECRTHPGWHPHIRGDGPSWLQEKIDIHFRNQHDKVRGAAATERERLNP